MSPADAGQSKPWVFLGLGRIGASSLPGQGGAGPGPTAPTMYPCPPNSQGREVKQLQMETVLWSQSPAEWLEMVVLRMLHVILLPRLMTSVPRDASSPLSCNALSGIKLP